VTSDFVPDANDANDVDGVDDPATADTDDPAAAGTHAPNEDGPGLRASLEAILLVADEPVPEVLLAQVLE
jgi:segregation and condensation protein B